MGITERILGLEGRRHARLLNAILDTVAEHHEQPDLELIRQAYALADKVHANQRRKSGDEAYIVHPLRVALECAEHWMDDASVAAALMHDCIEDADAEMQVTEAFVTNRFGPDVGHMVQGLTKLRRPDLDASQDPKLETLKKLLTTTATEDLRTIVIKIFDRVDNIKTVDVHRPDKQKRIAQETLQFYVPIAARLGFFKEARIMEDHVMRVLQPEVYKQINRWLSAHRKRYERRVGRIVDEIKASLKRMGLQCTSIFYHKGIFTIFDSLQNEKLPLSRIDEGCNFNLCLIVDDDDTAFRTLNLVHRKFVHLPTRFRDFINNPKVNGYQSLHTLVTGPRIPKIQVLIRTPEMHDTNHIGVISQLRSGKVEDTSWLDELVDSFAALGGSDLMELTSRVFYPEIDVITPRGETIKLPEGSTALDFAYAIHTDVGNQARLAIIDGHTRPLRTTLHSGQKVEIVKDPDTRPTYQRLGWVTNTRSQIAIRRALQRAEREAALAEVDSFLEFARERLGLTLTPDSPEFAALMRSLRFDEALEFGRELHAGRMDFDHAIPHLAQTVPADALRTLVSTLGKEGLFDPEETAAALALEDDEALRAMVVDVCCDHARDGDPGRMPIHIEGLRYPIPARLAGCCRPQHGDDIVAYTTHGRGAAIHRVTCRTIRPMVDLWPAQMAHASWKGPPQLEVVHFDLVGRDRRGLLLAISAVLSEIKVDAQSIKLNAEEDGSARGYAKLEMSDLNDRDEVVQRLRAIPGITSVHIRGDRAG